MTSSEHILLHLKDAEDRQPGHMHIAKDSKWNTILTLARKSCTKILARMYPEARNFNNSGWDT